MKRILLLLLVATLWVMTPGCMSEEEPQTGDNPVTSLSGDETETGVEHPNQPSVNLQPSQKADSPIERGQLTKTLENGLTAGELKGTQVRCEGSDLECKALQKDPKKGEPDPWLEDDDSEN